MANTLKMAFLIYPGFTTLDVVGPFEILHRIPGADAFFVAESKGPVVNDSGNLWLRAEKSLDEVQSADILVVGGGVKGTLDAMKDPIILSWVQRIHETSQVTFSVCTGSLILGAAGLLEGQPACTHWAAKDMLESLRSSYCDARYHRQGKILTAAGVSAGIDAALQLTAELTDQTTAEAIQLAAEYDPQPPFDSGSPKSAPAAVVAANLERLKAALQPTEAPA